MVAVQNNTTKNIHYKTLDILRAISAFLVILYHYTYRYNENSDIIKYGIATDWPVKISWGYGAIVTFFVLSGFLLSKYIESKETKPLSFLLNRLWRLYPTFWCSLSITTIGLIIIFPDIVITFKQYLINLTMLASSFRVKFIDGAYWTLTYEFKFAIVFAFILFFKSILIRRILLAILVMISSLYFLSNSLDSIYFRAINFILIPDWIQAFVIGISIYQLNKSGFKNRFYLLILLFCSISQLIVTSDIVILIFTYTTTAILLAMPIIERITISNSLFKIISFFASISYPLYLIHQMIGLGIIRQLQILGLSNELYIIIPIFISVGIAFLIHNYVEIPSAALKTKNY